MTHVERSLRRGVGISWADGLMAAVHARYVDLIDSRAG